jgi:type IV secretion system protein TrbL
MTCSILHPLTCLNSAAKSAAGDAFDSIAKDFAQAAGSSINWLWAQMSESTAVHLGGAGFSLDLAIVGAITGVVAVGLFMIQVIASTLRRDTAGFGRAFKGLVVAFLAGGIAIAVTNVLLDAVDSLSEGVVQVAMGTNINQMGGKILGGGAILNVSNPAAMMLLSVAAIAAVVVVWFALMVRKVLIVVSAVFAPLAFAGSLADITVNWTRKWIETMVALVVSKLVLVVIFVVGWGVLDHGIGRSGHGGAQTVTQTASGLLILGVAGLSPWMALKMVHFSGDQFHHLHGLAGAATGGARVAATAPQKAAAWKSTATGLAGGAGRAAAGGAAAGGALNARRPTSPPGPGTPGAAPPKSGSPGASGGGAFGGGASGGGWSPAVGAMAAVRGPQEQPGGPSGRPASLVVPGMGAERPARSEPAPVPDRLPQPSVVAP